MNSPIPLLVLHLRNLDFTCLAGAMLTPHYLTLALHAYQKPYLPLMPLRVGRSRSPMGGHHRCNGAAVRQLNAMRDGGGFGREEGGG